MEEKLAILPVFLHVIKKKIMDEHLRFFESQGLSKQHIPYMMLLSNHKNGLLQTEIIDIVKHDKAHASRALNDLLNLGYAAKDNEKGYKNKYHLTDVGFHIAVEVKHKHDDILNEIFSVISDDEKKMLEKILKKVVSHIDKI